MKHKSPKRTGFWRKHVDKVGAVGALITALCCLGVPWVIAIFFAVGLSFLITDSVLIPLLIIFLGATLFGLYSGMKRHRRPWALLLGIASAIVTVVFILFFYPPLVWVGLLGIVGAVILNAVT